MNVIVLGGYGNFGARICRALSTEAHINVIVAGRSLDKANVLATSLDHGESGACIDVSSSDLTQQLVELEADLVIHTAGPSLEAAGVASLILEHYDAVGDTTCRLCLS